MGSPIYAHNGDKFQAEADWSSGGFNPLVLRRNYLSSGFPRVPQTGIPNLGLGTYWRTSFDLRLATYTGATVTSKIAYRPDGSTRYFYQNGSNWTKRVEQSDSLVNILDGGGAVIGWKLTNADNSFEEYDLQGRATSINDASGWRQDLTYGANGLLATVTDALGRQLTFTYFTYDDHDWLQSITTPDGVIQYSIDVFGYLASVSYPGGAQRQYLYMEPAHIASTSRGGLLTGMLDENGDRYATFKYDTNGRAWSTEHGKGANKYTFAWASTNTATDPLGTARTVYKTVVKGFARTTGLSLACPTCGDAGNISASTFDANGNVASRTKFTGKKTCYAYDTTRNLETARVEGLTSAENCTTLLATPPNRPDVRKFTTTWNATWRMPATVAEPAPGGTKTTTFTYDGSGNLTRKSSVAPKNDGTGATITRTWSWTYGSFGRVLTATDPNGRVTTTTYHADNDPVLGKRGQVATVANSVSHVTQYTAYDAASRLTSMTDPNGLVTTLTYDVRGRLTSRTAGGEITTYTYDPPGQLTDVDLPDDATLAYVYDTAHRLTEVHDGLGNKIVYTLDGMGNRTKEEAFDSTSALARTRSRVYDTLNRLAQEIGAQAQTTVITYDGNGNRLTSTDPLNHTTTSTYDALNRLLTATDPGTGITRYAYDKADNLTTVTDPRNLVTTYGYDGLGNQVSLVSPDTGTTTRTFDAAGNVKTVTDARGAKATYTYDAANRVTKIVHSQTGFTSETHTWTWDGGTTGAPNTKGRLTQLTDPSGTTKWSYTPHGRVTSRQQIAGGVTLTLGYSWSNGRMSGITTPSGQQIGYIYGNGRIGGITVNGSPLIGSGGYEPFGPVSVWQWANGHKTYRDHDLDGRLASWEYRNGASVLRRDLAFDAASRITGVTDPASAANSSTYGYDELDRLTTAQSAAATPSTRQYAYDAIGNRLNATIDGALTNYGYGPTSHQLLNLTGATSRNYTYDAAGNPVQIDGRTATYNLANRPAKLADGAITVATYKMNGLGQRIAKTVGTTTTRNVYDEQGRLLGEYAANGALIQETVWLDDLPIATLRPTGTGTPTPVALYYVHADHLGSPRAITRPSDDAILWRWDNEDPFGSNAANENPLGQGTFRYDLRFPGQQFDLETGTHYNWYRDYDPSTGRYEQSDPIGLGGGLSLYQYADSNSISNTDPRGLATYMCTRRLNNVPFRFGPLYHQYICVGSAQSGFTCGGLGPSTSNIFDTPGTIESDRMTPKSCQVMQDDNDCVEECIKKTFAQSLPNYSVDLSRGENCQTYANTTVTDCVAICKTRRK